MSSAREPRTLAGRYRLEEVIGRGGMSTVYRGTDLSLGRVVAVKVALDPLVEESPIYLARFTQEAKSAAAIGHPGVVTVYDAGADGPTRFIVMEFVPGKSLADILKEERPLEPARAANIAAQVADALAAAHAAGIIHRDIKPGNIMVEPSGQVKVLDFGIARAVDGGSLTQTATVLGTSAYMSPEQALGQPVDARTDIYSLGCVLYEMLTGEPPFVADVAAAVMHQHVRVAPKPAIERNPNIPPSLNDLVMQMLAKSPKDRPQTAAEVRDRLRQAIANPGDGDALTTLAMAAALPTAATVPIEAAPPPTPAPSPVRQTPTPPRPRETRPTPPPPPPRKSRTGVWVLIALIAALLLGGGAALALGGGSDTSSSTTGHSTAATSSSHPATHSATSPPPTSTPRTTTSTPRTTTSTLHTTTSKPATTTHTTTSTPKTTTANAPTTSTNAPTTSTGGATTGPTTP
ncbi:MAG TPA: protein kinase [Solirubrobacteraceae bacterium]